MGRNSNVIGTEACEQEALFAWTEYQKSKYPELELMYHIPNGGSRNKIEAARLKAQGVKPGVPDVCLPVPRGKYHGLYIELKRTQGGRVSNEQFEWLDKLFVYGYAVAVCRGWEAARDVIVKYMEEKL